MSSLHDQLGKRAFELLPSWEQDFWNCEKDNIPQYCFYPDLHLAEQWGSPEKLKFYEKYCLMPNGKCIPHGPTGADWMSASFAGTLSPEPVDYALNYYCPLIIDLIRAGEHTESARFAGTLAHLLQDSCLPVHSMNNITINQLYPPANGKYHFWHRLFDGAPFDQEAITGEPELLACDLPGLITILRERIFFTLEKNIALLPEFIQAYYTDEPERIKTVSQQVNENAVMLTISLWHTLFMIAENRISEKDRENFRKLPLTSFPMILSYDRIFDRQKFIDAGIPFYQTLYPESDPCRSRLSVNPYPFEPAVDHAYDGNGNLIGLTLRINGEKRTASGGIAVGTFGIASYRVNGELFAGLEVYAGVHSDNDFDGEVIFAIWCHEADSPLLAKGTVSRNSDALYFKTELPRECRTISLLSVGGNGKSSALWFEPTLIFR